MKFLGADTPEEAARVVIVGAGLDDTVSYRPGTRFAPLAIREASLILETFSLRVDRDLEEVSLADAGDLEIFPGQTQASLAAIRGRVAKILARRQVPFLLGGEHLVTYPAVQAAASFFPELCVLQFDAHADLRRDYQGQELSHAATMYLVGREIGFTNLFQIGIRSGTREEIAGTGGSTHIYPTNDLAGAVRQARAVISGRPLYLTIDMDIVDPAAAPGVGTPEPGGCSSAELLEAIYALAGEYFVGIDLVEVNPLLLAGEPTAVLAAKVIREAVLAFF